jgi:hypothetical protein
VFLGAPGASSSSMVGTRKVGRDGDLGGSPGIGFVWRYDLISVVMLPTRRRPQMRLPTTPPPFGPRIQTLGISVLFAVAGQCTTTPFERSGLAFGFGHRGFACGSLQSCGLPI